MPFAEGKTTREILRRHLHQNGADTNEVEVGTSVKRIPFKFRGNEQSVKI